MVRKNKVVWKKGEKKGTTRQHQKKEKRFLEYPSQSPDLSATEMFWYDLKRAIQTRQCENMTKLKQFYKTLTVVRSDVQLQETFGD